MTDIPTRLSEYLPPADGRTPADRLRAIAGRALADSRKTFPPITPDQANDAFAHLLEIGLRCTIEYDPTLDSGTGNVPADIRFGRFAYLRMRHRFVDWYRKNIHDNRPGKTDRRVDLLDPQDVELRRSSAPWETADFDALASLVRWKLTPVQQWSFDNLARPSAEGTPLLTIVKQASVNVDLADLLLADLESALTDLTEAA